MGEPRTAEEESGTGCAAGHGVDPRAWASGEETTSCRLAWGARCLTVGSSAMNSLPNPLSEEV